MERKAAFWNLMCIYEQITLFLYLNQIINVHTLIFKVIAIELKWLRTLYRLVDSSCTGTLVAETVFKYPLKSGFTAQIDEQFNSWSFSWDILIPRQISKLLHAQKCVIVIVDYSNRVFWPSFLSKEKNKGVHHAALTMHEIQGEPFNLLTYDH